MVGLVVLIVAFVVFLFLTSKRPKQETSDALTPEEDSDE